MFVQVSLQIEKKILNVLLCYECVEDFHYICHLFSVLLDKKFIIALLTTRECYICLHILYIVLNSN